jgi:hypothetical protein
MSLTPEETPPARAYTSSACRGLQRLHPDYAEAQALATLSLVETLQEVAC